jgi:hypothetical protein
MIKIGKPYCTEESYTAAGINAFGSIDAPLSETSGEWMYISSVNLADSRTKVVAEDTFKNSNTRKSRKVVRIINK